MIAAGVIDVAINIGYVFFNPDWSLAGPAAWLWEGTIDSFHRKVGDGIADRRILSAVSGAATRKRAGRRYWSNAGHQSRHPGDLICDNMSLMSGHADVPWPT